VSNAPADAHVPSNREAYSKKGVDRSRRPIVVSLNPPESRGPRDETYLADSLVDKLPKKRAPAEASALIPFSLLSKKRGRSSTGPSHGLVMVPR
jgi:hypothetical protein